MFLNEIDGVDLKKRLPSFPQTRYKYEPFYADFSSIRDGLKHKIDDWTFIKRDKRFYFKIAADSFMAGLCVYYLNVYGEEVNELQSFKSIYSYEYFYNHFIFKIDSNNKLSNLHDKRLVYYDSKKEFIREVQILVDRLTK